MNWSRQMFLTVKEQLGPVTHLVNNAGVIGPKGASGTLLGADPVDQVEKILAVIRSVHHISVLSS